MLMNIHDYNYIDCFRNKIIDKNPDYGKIIFNEKSKLQSILETMKKV
jgi:hypothetical protein